MLKLETKSVCCLLLAVEGLRGKWVDDLAVNCGSLSRMKRREGFAGIPCSSRVDLQPFTLGGLQPLDRT